MRKKIMLILGIGGMVFFISFGLAQSAQKYSQEETGFPDFSERFTRIETKLEALSKNIDSANKEMARKLDQVLSNQEKILKELAIVKIRASRI
ncbi:MAG: hypothetical protein A3G37_00520 [Omnitrophica WOR_2 bacterium RIFCSPLOWO2_12_FULL_46_30]|nr:MAG: hypothetical protein A3D27_01985 [Omnitrophica WOR_2 bacterium RIFCSPHIGHO2_02_FULL_46_37]OGX42542.1 MAG: hypothetical protein A3H41_02435 [Omnitrophica WOR_2 bacterium RIFCSPLOWO2_02_FULL_45_28]OGX51901.1 MAG: hypothetical protein A3G37_00520 [Omnitrophica WOR_2 bacterium RIFCSPLOWO2_12_FULL_46_30]